VNTLDLRLAGAARVQHGPRRGRRQRAARRASGGARQSEDAHALRHEHEGMGMIPAALPQLPPGGLLETRRSDP